MSELTIVIGSFLEKDQGERDLRLFPQPVEFGQHRLGAEIARPDIDADGQRLALLAAAQQRAQHGKRQIVHRLIAEILQPFQGQAFARPRQAGDHDDVGRARIGFTGLVGTRHRLVRHGLAHGQVWIGL